MIQLEPAIKSLFAAEAELVISGGVPVVFHGSAYVTQDLDFCFLRTKSNIEKIVVALARFHPRPRGFPENLPFFFDERTLESGTNFTFRTNIGDIALLGEVAGIGDFAEVEKMSVEMQAFGCQIKVLSIEGLIKAKRAAGRVKDLLVLPELEALREVLIEGGEEIEEA